MRQILFSLVATLFVIQFANAQADEHVANYDEAKVGTFTLPDPLIDVAGKPVKTQVGWSRRRAELKQVFAENVYGKTPTKAVRLRFQTVQTNNDALSGLAIRKQVSIFFVDYPQLPPINVLLYVPKAAKKQVPVFLGLNFCGNQCVTTESDILLATRWINIDNGQVSVANSAPEKTRGLQARRWPIELILKRGYALATAYYGDIELDYPQGWHSGIRSVLGDTTQADNWGAVGAWAWGMSRILDYIKTDPTLDVQRVISFGHSRLGKAALWAGVQDERFAAVVANESGEGGAALARRWYGETVERINTTFPHWFCARYKTYNKHVTDLPVDQHELLALVAPRPLYVASADGDQWSDPKGEFLGAAYTEPVYRLYGKVGLGTSTFPPLNNPIGQTVRYHDRTGIHDVTDYDWEQYLRFADELVR